MDDISKIKIGATTYSIKDAVARQVIENISSPMNFLGVSTSGITDGGEEQPTIGSEKKTPKVGDVVVYGSAEFVWGPKADSEGNCWYKFGDTTDLGKFAYADTGTASYTPRGNISISDFTPVGEIEVTVGNVGTTTKAVLTGATAAFTGKKVTPTATFVGEELSGAVSITPAGTVTVAEYTPEGDVEVTADEFTPKGTVSVTVDSYTPSGTIAAPAFTGTPVAATTYATYAEETLTLGDISVAGSVAAPVFKGTAATPTASATFSGTAESPTVSASFTGSAKAPTATFAGKAATGTFTGTPAGTITVEEITPSGSVAVTPSTADVIASVTKPTVTAEFTGTAGAVTGTFTGTGATISVTPVSKS